MNSYIAPKHSTRTNDRTTLNTPSPFALLESNEGDIIIGADGDLLIANSKEGVYQRLIWFVLTRKNSIPMYPGFGCRLDSLFGKFSDNLAVLEKAKLELLQDLISNNFRVVESKTDILPYSNGSIIVKITILDNAPVSRTAGQKIEHVYQLQTDTQTIEFLGARTY